MVLQYGITIVCDEYEQYGQQVSLKAPQIVNGCQTAKTIAKFFETKTKREIEKVNTTGSLLVKVIRTKRSAEEKQKKELRDNITRYTNSQNAVRGLDFYALDEFQRNLRDKFEKIGYYYEIQRGAFITLDTTKQRSYVGVPEYNYLLPSGNSFKKYVLPAKEVMQSFTAAIKLRPNIAYGRANELTPDGKYWDDLVNDRTAKLPMEHFLFPYLVLIYTKNELNYKTGARDFKKNATFLLISTYYFFLVKLISSIIEKPFNSPEEIDIRIYESIFKNEYLNKELLETADRILEDYFFDSAIENAVGNDLRGFLQNKVHLASYWSILERKIEQRVRRLSNESVNEVKNIIKELE